MPRPNGRDPETDPAALLGEHLRDLRIDAGYATQADLAARIGYGQDVISRAETGSQPPSNKVFGRWMDACQATPRERRILAGQLKLARKARGAIPQFIEKWFANEAKAAFLRLWALMFMPGQFQTASTPTPCSWRKASMRTKLPRRPTSGSADRPSSMARTRST